MSGPTEFALYPIIGASAVAAATDLARGKIYNWLTLPTLLMGFFCAAWFGGWPALLASFLGAAAGFALYGWMFWIGMMGAGDVKLLMALGAWGGPRYALHVAFLGVLLGGVMAFFILLFKGRLGDFFGRMKRFALSLAVRELEVEVPKVDRKLTMPFGLSIAASAIWLVFDNPVARWGLLPW